MINSALVRKEISEIARTYRLWVIPIVFLFIGLSAPASVKFLPDILRGQLEAQNIKIQLPEPTATEAFIAYVKNMTQLGVLAVILLTMGLVSEEKASGCLAQVLTKPLRRASVITSKFLVQGAFLTVSAVTAGASTYLYTLALFGRADVVAFARGSLLLLVYLLVVFTVTLALSGVIANQIFVGGLSLLIVLAMTVLSTISAFLERNTPVGLLSLAGRLFKGQSAFSEVQWPLLTSAFLIVILLAFASLAFQRQEF